MRPDRTCSIIETDKATGDKDPCVHDFELVKKLSDKIVQGLKSEAVVADH